MVATKLTQQEFINHCNIKHNNKYDYSKIVYTGILNQIVVICPIHGEFNQKASHHSRGNGCMNCRRDLDKLNKTKNQFQIISEFKNIHGDKYDYSRVKYTKIHTHVEIICPKHGSFMQTPNDHKRGGCSRCGRESTRLTTQEFVDRCNIVHDNKYDYSKTTFVAHKERIVIICPIHGEFLQLAYKHQKGGGCKGCSDAKHIESRPIRQQEFIEKSTIVHNNKYDYSRVKYIRGDRKVTIICPVHGEFQQRPSDHILCGNGCLQCNRIGVYSEHWFRTHHQKATSQGTLYLVEFKRDGEMFYKIGITCRRIKDRWTHKYGYQITTLYDLKDTLYTVFCLEQKMLNTVLLEHKYIPTHKISTGVPRECFVLDTLSIDDIIKEIKKIHSEL